MNPGKDIGQPFAFDLPGIFHMVSLQFLHQIRILHPDGLKLLGPFSVSLSPVIDSGVMVSSLILPALNNSLNSL